MKNVAVILAGGVGSRMGYSTPKQFYKVAGKTVIEHTIDAFESHGGIDEIAVVINEACIDRMEDIILRNKWRKLKKLLKGGAERYMSTLSAIESYDNEEANLIFHDAVRPLVSRRVIDDVITALTEHEAIDVAVPATDTIIEVNAAGDTISSIPPRATLRRGQTPQAFRLSVIKEAYRRALQDPAFVSTDDCGTVIKYMPEVPVYVVPGEESNMKLTYKEDSYLLDKLFQLKGTTVHGNADFTQLNGKVIAVFGGNSGIGEEIVKMAVENGAKVYSFSRSTTGTDISDVESVKKSIRDVAEKEGGIDYVVNSAAILMKEPLMTMSHEAIKVIINTNYWGMVNVAMASYEWLKKSNGQLLLFTSSSYTRGRAFYSLYSSTKAAAVNFAQALAQEWDSDGIRINVINPERTKTPMRVKNFGVEPDNTLLKADDVARVSLCTLLSDFTGQVVDVKIKKN
ncbi:MAG: bifunctional cytidylyltransferase/SDR family oxidoreductase [Bacteroidales bacterium]|nr:bifunctional cytidylyltransferase/SDR family oxidoreductase [Bacteroidales bacterium]